MAHSIIYVSDGTAGGLTKGKLAPIVQGQSGQVLTLEVRDLGNNLVDLTGYSTITGRKRANSSGDVTSIVGALALSGTPTASPQATFTIDEDDSGESGYFTTIITFSNGVNILKCFPASWHIQNDPAVNATTAAGTVGVTETQASLLASLATTTGLAEFNGTGGRTAIVIQAFMRSFLAAATVILARIGLLPAYTGNTGKVLAVNGAETDVEWVAQGGGGAVETVFGRGGPDVIAVAGDYAASEIADDSDMAKASVAAALNTLAASLDGMETTTQAHYDATTTVHGIADTAALLTTSVIGSTVQAYSAKTAAIAALTWAASSIILLTGTATASVQALAAHIVTLLQSASAADARTAIGSASLGANTFTAEQNLADNLLTRPVIKDYGETVNALGNVSGTMTIDLENGNYVTATLTGAVTVLAINNWPATGTLGSLTLELAPAGNTVVWTGVTWVGDEPTLGSTVDFVVLWSHTAGATIYAAAPGATA